MNDLLFDLFAYDHWANTQWLEHLRNLDNRSLESEGLLSPIAAVKRLWWKRLHGEDTAGFEV